MLRQCAQMCRRSCEEVPVNIKSGGRRGEEAKREEPRRELESLRLLGRERAREDSFRGGTTSDVERAGGYGAQGSRRMPT